MARTFILSVLITVLVLVTSQAVEQRITDTKNEFGGKTVLTRYDESDREFKLERKSEYYDENGVLRKVIAFRPRNEYNVLDVEKGIELYSEKGNLESTEIFIRDEKAREIGYNHVKTYYNELKQLIKKEIYYTKSDFSDQIYSKSVDYFEINGNKIRTEYYLSEDESRRTGYHVLVATYDKGKLVKQELMDKQGKRY